MTKKTAVLSVWEYEIRFSVHLEDKKRNFSQDEIFGSKIFPLHSVQLSQVAIVFAKHVPFHSVMRNEEVFLTLFTQDCWTPLVSISATDLDIIRTDYVKYWLVAIEVKLNLSWITLVTTQLRWCGGVL